MKKLALVVGSLLVVSAVASAKEVVPAPKMVAPEAPVKVVEKVVVKEVPVEKVVVKEVVKEVAAPKKWQPSGSFDVNYEVGLYSHEFKENNTPVNFFAHSKEGTLNTSSKVTFAPKHTISLKTKTGLTLIPSYDEAGKKWKKLDGTDDKAKSAEVTYSYKYNDMATLNLSGTLDKNGKTVAVKPVFDVKEYFFKNDYVSAKSLAFTPAYSYTWVDAFDDAKGGRHQLSLGAKATFALPADVELELDLSKFFVLRAKQFEADKPYEFLKIGEAEASLGKEFALYENGNHSVDLGLKGTANVKYNWTEDDIKTYNKHNINSDTDNTNDNPRVDKEYENNAMNKIYNYSFGAEAELTYNYKFNDYAKLYTTLSAEFKADKDRNGKKEDDKTLFDMKRTVEPKAKVGFKVTF